MNQEEYEYEKEEWIAEYSTYCKVLDDVHQFLNRYCAIFEQRKSWTNLDIEEDTITFDVEYSYCSCCASEYEERIIPVDYLWDDLWEDRETRSRQCIQDAEMEAKAKEEQRKAEQAEESERAMYERLKNKFDK